MGGATDHHWILTVEPASPSAIWKFLQDNKSITSIKFCSDPLSAMLQGAIANGEASYLRFVTEYKKSVEFAWISACALLGDDNWKPETVPSVRREHGKIKLELTSTAIGAIRRRSAQEVTRAAVIPEVLSGMILNFYRSLGSKAGLLQIGLGDQDTQNLIASREWTILSIACAQFVRGKKNELSSCAPYYELEGIQTYGFDHSKVRNRVRYKATPDEPQPPTNGIIEIATYLCFPTFTSYDGSGLNLALQRNLEAPPASSETDKLPASICWYNHHARGSLSDDKGKDCPDHHFEVDAESKLWRDVSIKPYVEEWDKELRDDPNVDYLALITTGVSFQSHLLGLFLSLAVRFSASARDTAGKQMALFMKDARSHIGHYRFLALGNLATEIWADAEALRKREECLSAELKKASMPFAAQHGHFLLFLEAAKNVRRVIDPLSIDISSFKIAQVLASEIMDGAAYHTYSDVELLSDSSELKALLDSLFKAIESRTRHLDDEGKPLTELILTMAKAHECVKARWCLAHAFYKETIPLIILTENTDHLGLELRCASERPVDEGWNETGLNLLYASAQLASWKRAGFSFQLENVQNGTAELVVKPVELIRDWATGLKPSIRGWWDGTRHRPDLGGNTSRPWARVLRGCAGILEPTQRQQWLDGITIETASLRIPIRVGNEKAKRR